ncbi:MAG TPA: hypothetical protein VK638_16310, partial [Edaphobacter sp.]|nr:hypothetical protein [Edaphobacter sp.]
LHILWGSATALVIGVFAMALTMPDHVTFVNSEQLGIYLMSRRSIGAKSPKSLAPYRQCP